MRKVFLLVSAMLTVTAMLSCIKYNTLSMNQDNPGPSTDVDNTEQTIILSVKHCGALADGVTLDTQAIQSAIDRVSSSGGGTVLVPSGVYLTGSIWLKDNVNLHLKEGAVIKGSPDIDDYCAADCCPQNEAEIGWGII